VVDFDDLHAYEQLAARFPCVTEAPRVQTRKGYHVYFSYNRVANMSIPHEHKIDLQNDKKCVYYPPTKYRIDDHEVEYKWVRQGALLDMPADLLAHLQSLASRKAASARRNATRTSSSANASAPAPADGDIEPEEETELTVEEKTELARQFLRLIGQDIKATYARWFMMLCGCWWLGVHDTCRLGSSLGYAEWRELAWEELCWCDRSEFEQKWIDVPTYAHSGCARVLHGYAQESSPEAYKALVDANPFLNLEGDPQDDMEAITNLSEVAARRWVSIDGSASSRLVYVFDSRSGLWSCKAEAFYRRRVASVRA